MSAEVPRLVDHLFRREAGRLVSTLTRLFGPENLQLAEDVVQEALIQALRTWPFQGVPENPRAWLARVARNRALDVLRRDANLARKAEAVREWTSSVTGEDESGEQEAIDDQLRMIFICCQPSVPQEARVALVLKTLGGFGVPEIARAYLAKDATIAADWPQILSLYDALLDVKPSPVVALNRAVALGMVAGPAAGLAEIEEIRDHPSLAGYYPLPVTMGELYLQAGDAARAAECFQAALELECPEPVRRRLAARAQGITSRNPLGP